MGKPLSEIRQGLFHINSESLEVIPDLFFVN